MTVPIASITDTTRGVFKLTGPCSMADPCPGDTCREHPETSTAAVGGEAAAAVEPMMVLDLRPTPDELAAAINEAIHKAITDEFGLQRCPCCDGDGVVPRPWPSPDSDPVACPVCDQAGRVTPTERSEWLDWHEGQAS